MLVRCECCAGRKTVIGLGNVTRKCHECSGIGFVECNDIKNAVIETVCASASDLDVVSIKEDKEQGELSKKELQSLKMKEAWAKRKASK